MTHDDNEALQTGTEGQESANLSPQEQRAIEKQKRREENRQAWHNSRNNAANNATPRAPVAAATGETREQLLDAIAHEIASVIGSNPTADEITDGAIISRLRGTVTQLIGVALPSLLLLDGRALVDAIERLVNVILLLEGRATNIVEDKTALTHEERAQALQRIAEMINNSSGEV